MGQGQCVARVVEKTADELLTTAGRATGGIFIGGLDRHSSSADAVI